MAQTHFNLAASLTPEWIILPVFFFATRCLYFDAWICILIPTRRNCWIRFLLELWKRVVARCLTCIMTSFQIEVRARHTSFGIGFGLVAIPFAFSFQGCWCWRIGVPIPLPLVNKPIVYLLQLQTSFLNQLCFIFLLKTGKQQNQ